MSETATRRFKSVPAVVVGSIVAVTLLPVLLVAALAVDLVRKLVRGTPFMATRLILFGTVYLLAETVGLVSAAWVWLTSWSRSGRHRRTYRIQARWADTLLRTVTGLFGLRFNVDGTETVTPGPIFVLARHTSIVDNLLPSRYISRAGIRLRYVLKQELLADPALDVVGNRLPNAFIDRESPSALQRIAELASDIGTNDGVLIFPEGTRFSPEKLERSRQILGRRSPRLAELAEGLRSVLPPRPGGVLTLLESARADVVILAHRGLEGFARVKDIWRGAMVGKSVDVRLWRIPYDRIPTTRDERTEWLFRIWHEIDDWANDRGLALDG